MFVWGPKIKYFYGTSVMILILMLPTNIIVIYCYRSDFKNRRLSNMPRRKLREYFEKNLYFCSSFLVSYLVNYLVRKKEMYFICSIVNIHKDFRSMSKNNIKYTNNLKLKHYIYILCNKV